MIQSRNSVSSKYRLSFTAVSLRPDLARIAAEAYIECGTWVEARRKILAENAFQIRTKTGLHRMEREIRPRLQHLTKEQLLLLIEGTSEERAAMAWLSMIKHSALVFEFAADLESILVDGGRHHRRLTRKTQIR